MSLATANELASLVSEAGDAFISDAETELDRYFADTTQALTLSSPDDARRSLEPLTLALLLALAGLWSYQLNQLLRRTHTRLSLPPPEPYSEEEAQAMMQPGVDALLSAALMTIRTNRATPESIRAAWQRQYEVGGAFTALRGSIRGATAGTFNTLANASVIDTVRTRGSPDDILGAYNPLDERTAELDWQLCLNTGQSLRTNRGRIVTSIPGMVGKYTLDNAWVPGPPKYGGDTHWGCRCWLVPERRTP